MTACTTCRGRGVYQVYVTHFEWREPGAPVSMLPNDGGIQLAFCPDCPAEETVPGSVACALAFDLGAARARNEGPWQVLFDALAEGASVDVLVVLAEAVGVRLTKVAQRLALQPQWALSKVTDDELRAECRRRGWRPEMGLAPRVDPPVRLPTSLPDLPSELRPGHVFADLRVDHALGPDETVMAQIVGGEVRDVVRVRNIDVEGVTAEETGAALIDEGIRLAGLLPTPRIREYGRRVLAAYGFPPGADISARELARQLRQIEGLPVEG